MKIYKAFGFFLSVGLLVPLLPLPRVHCRDDQSYNPSTFGAGGNPTRDKHES